MLRSSTSEDQAEPDRKPLTPGDLEGTLTRMIESGHLPHGSRIGAERELAERHSVGRWTLRKALEALENKGLIYRIHGRSGGVFVAHQKVVRDLSRLVGLPEYFRTQGLESGTKVVETSTFSADEQMAKSLGISTGDWVLKIVRIRFSAGYPLSIEWCHFPASMFPDLLDQALAGSLYDILDSRYELDRGDAVEIIEAISANAQRSSELQVSIGSPLLSVTRTAHTTDGTIFEFSREIYRGERVTVKVRTTGKKDSNAPSILGPRKNGAGAYEIVREQ